MKKLQIEIDNIHVMIIENKNQSIELKSKYLGNKGLISNFYWMICSVENLEKRLSLIEKLVELRQTFDKAISDFDK